MPDPRSPEPTPPAQSATPPGIPPTVPNTRAPDGTGRTVGGRYRLVERLGGGGMGTVWRAVDDVVGRTVAIKEPRLPEYLSEAERANAHERMRREAKAAAGIAHPNVVNVFDVVVEGGRPWIVMELVPGRTLADELTEGTLAPGRAAEIGLAVLEALGAAHRAGILHRDVKPANVLLNPDGRVILTDFGIARIEGEQPLTRSDAIIGSPEYVAPERVNGLRPGPPADLWSLGVLLYEAIEGLSPFRRGTALTTMLAVRDEDVRPPRQAGPLTKLITALLKKDPDKRPTVAEARRALRAAAPKPPAGGDDDAPPVPWWRQRRVQAIGGGGAVVVVALVVLFSLASPFGGEDAPGGYRRYDEPQLHASIAVPKDYRRKLAGGKAAQTLHFTEPGGVISVILYRTKDSDDALSAAEKFMDGYKADDVQYQLNQYNTPSDDGAWVNLSNTLVDGTHRFHGSRVGTMDFTYQKWDTDSDKPSEQTYRQMEMVAVGKDGWTYDLYAQFPADGTPGKEGAEVYRTVHDNLHLDEL
ncbi:serine/threonine-protein kinase [Streptomyces odontomachi]|uniref:serine/threonine-protein kinase n=1 Tax=Streptomyces odontomachi TaxID=2944940 RepID=UPI00210E9DE9|nr:serine/threonine-protein kinase [Streptomyces sp. ODS25]